jgi:phage head maturation protease
MAEDHHGLHVKGRLLVDDVAKAREVYALIKAGAVNGLSIGYRPLVEEFDRTTEVNRLKEVDLWETSLVVFPANEAAVVTSIKTIREFETFLREAGWSRAEAKHIASAGFAQREAGNMDRLIEKLNRNIQLLEE